jgi:arsenite methyltransferase
MKVIADDLRDSVREAYAEFAKKGSSCCGSDSSCGCDDSHESYSIQLGYAKDDLDAIPDGANLGLGCGNPGAIASLKPGETVVDLGSGGGFDCFLAAKEVGETGRVIGVDMTPEMITLSRRNAEQSKYANVEFRLGEIEHLPVADSTAAVLISNCVINLSPDKPQVYRDAFRVLKPGGRIAFSDMVATAPFPEELRGDLVLHSACLSGAPLIEELRVMIAEAGFTDIRVAPVDGSSEFIKNWVPGSPVADLIVSATVEAVRPN